jgi:phospholipid-binding lipoprotein MlaA
MTRLYHWACIALLATSAALASPHSSSTPALMPVLAEPSSAGPAAAKPGEPSDTKKTGDASTESDDGFISLLPEETTTAAANPKDPLETYNRIVYKINDKLDIYFAKPVSKLYNKILPRPLNNMVDRFFMNFDTITSIANDVLQANFYQTTSDSWRLLINSTAGIGGLFDIAAKLGLKHNMEDFGLTMAKWGWTDSSYFVIPVLGPSTVRDAGGRIVNYEISFFPYIKSVFRRNALYIWRLLNQRAQLLRFEGVFDQAAIDPYVFSRNAYLQHRNYLIQRNQVLNNPYKPKDMKKFYHPFYLYN